MTIQEMGAIMDVLTVAYPVYYKKSTEEERFMACQLWAQMFADDSAEIVTEAVKSFICTDTKGFPPVVGQIKEYVHRVNINREFDLLIEADIKRIESHNKASFKSSFEPKALPPIQEEITHDCASYEQAVNISAEYFPAFKPKLQYKPLPQEDFEKRKQELLRKISEESA